VPDRLSGSRTTNVSEDAEAATLDHYKQQAAERAAELVCSGMVVGLGTGSTATYATRRLAELLRARLLRDIVGVPTSRATAVVAGQLGIPLLTGNVATQVDLTIDGADEVSAEFHLIKGGGGALLREKIVAESSRRLVIVVDESKLSPNLGTRAPLPVEVVQFGWHPLAEYLRALGADVTLRAHSGGEPFVTDQGNYILDCAFGQILNPGTLAASIRARAGIVEHGMFIGLTSDVIVAGVRGVRHLSASNAAAGSHGARPEPVNLPRGSQPQ
jgi:ribose 5-phosphate isomerase A